MDFNECITVGMKHENTFQVDEQYTAFHIGSGALRVLATPSMIGFMERTSHQLLMRCLPEGYSSVGSLVDVRHLAPTPMGWTVRITSEVVEVDGRKVTLAVEAWDGQEKVGEGRHQRVVIDLNRFLSRVEAKRQGGA
jgi:fluoroacetyl-CoA thioesterase